MAAQYGKYTYNGRLFHLHDDGIINEYDLIWNIGQKGLGQYQAQAKARPLAPVIEWALLFLIGAVSVFFAFEPGRIGSEDNPMYRFLALAVPGIVFWIIAFVSLSFINNRVVFHERGIRLITCFGFRKHDVLYRDIDRLEKHHVKLKTGSMDNYFVQAGKKKYSWTTDTYAGAGQITDLLLHKCFRYKGP